MKLLVATPRHDGRADGCYINGLMSVLKELPGASVMFLDGESDMRRARNDCAATFLYDTKDDLLFFIDSDIEWNASHVARIISHNLPIVGGLYPKKRDEGGWVVTGIGEEHPEKPDLAQVQHIGTGFLCIHRGALEGIKTVVDSCIRRNREWWDFFCSGIYDGTYLTEDYGFCEKAHKAGVPVWVDRRIMLGHRGSKVFRG